VSKHDQLTKSTSNRAMLDGCDVFIVLISELPSGRTRPPTFYQVLHLGASGLCH
jgi:hypothetical protein